MSNDSTCDFENQIKFTLSVHNAWISLKNKIHFLITRSWKILKHRLIIEWSLWYDDIFILVSFSSFFLYCYAFIHIIIIFGCLSVHLKIKDYFYPFIFVTNRNDLIWWWLSLIYQCEWIKWINRIIVLFTNPFIYSFKVRLFYTNFKFWKKTWHWPQNLWTKQYHQAV